MSREAKDHNDRWHITGHEFLGLQLRVRASLLPKHEIDEASEGLEGVITKWTPAQGPDSPLTLFRLTFEGLGPSSNLAGHDGSGIDLEENEVRDLMRPYVTRARSRLAEG